MTLPLLHLNDDQFTDYVAGTPLPPQANAHLAACEICQQEVHTFLATMDQMGAMSLAWGKSRLPAVTLASGQASAPRWHLALPQFSMAAAALVLVIGGFALRHADHAASPSVPTTGQTTEIHDSPTQIAQDNQLLESVDVALSNNEPSPYQEYGLEDARAKSQPTSQGAQRE